MVLTDLKALAGRLGIRGTSGMRKGDLVAAIAAHQAGQRPTERRAVRTDPGVNGSSNGSPGGRSASERATGSADGTAGSPAEVTAGSPAEVTAGSPAEANGVSAPARPRRSATRRAGAPDSQPTLTESVPDAPPTAAASRGIRSSGPGTAATSGTNGTVVANGAARAVSTDRPSNPPAPAGAEERPDSGPASGTDDRSGSDAGRRNRRNRRDRGEHADAGDRTGEASPPAHRRAEETASAGPGDRERQAAVSGSEDQAPRQQSGHQASGGQQPQNQTRGYEGAREGNRQYDGARQNADNRQGTDNRPTTTVDRRDDEDGDGRRRGRRFRDRNRRGRDRGASDSGEPEIREDDVLVPVAGIIDVLDSYAFIRTSGYLAGPNDVYVSLSQVRRYGLRRGDKVTGAIRAAREGEPQQQRQKFNPLVRLDTINDLDPELSRNRPEFTKLTPLYPNQRLRLETEPHILTTRVIDLVMPVGKGQRALIVAPPMAGKTMIMQAIANAIATNNPECHLMVVLVDERPEEVTDMQRSVKGEVIASTFDRPPSDHTMVAELAIERAKRLVEMGRDVVVLLDSITRLGRAYNLAAPASGRILSGGVDSTALFPPKRFLGAARNIEDGGSLTIFASTLVETGSAGDTVIFEEFKGTGNAELKLDRRLAEKRIFPAIDVDSSSTRKEELLLGPDERAVTLKLRRVLAALEPQPALELVLGQLRKTKTNIEFLMQVAKNMPMAD
jgi:transcription termination factor Rho